MSAALNLTEILSSLQDEITVDGVISTEHRSFYTTFRAQLDDHPGAFMAPDIQRLMIAARAVMAGEITDEEFELFTKAVLSKISTKELLEVETKQQEERRLAEKAAEIIRLAEEEAREKVEEEYRLKAIAEAQEKAAAEAAQAPTPEENELASEENAR
ncbi:MAG: hypothetical protein HON05_02450, partial [Euryarchaeota archaeon]|nr:hypothetical protein [Euryarchaeota archaeon]